MPRRPLFTRACALAAAVCALTLPAGRLSAEPRLSSDAPPGAALSGVARDASGAAIPRATIVVRQQAAGLDRVVRSAADGRFTIEQAPPGAYLVTVSAPGFERVARAMQLPATEPAVFTLAPAPIVEQLTVTSASRQQELRESLNTRVDVITRSRIDETGGHETVGEILRELPGVVTRRGSETAGAAGEQIQGVDSRQVLVLIDGQPLVGARGIKRGGVLNLDRQSTARLERIEVVKGAASALYGSEAIGGVINLITRESSRPFEAGVALSGGSFGVVNARVDGGFRRDRTSGIFSVERHQHNGFDLTPGTFDTTGAPYRRYDALGKLQRQFTPSLAAGVMVTGYHNDTGGRSNGELGPQEDDIQDRALSASVTSDWLMGGTTLQVRAYASAFRETSRAQLAPPASTPLEPGSLAERYQKADVSIARTLGAAQFVQGGAEWSRDRYEGTNRVRDEGAGHRADTFVAWVQHRWAVSDRLTTTVGARVDRRSRFETAVSPKAAASFRLTDRLYARASYGRGFRAPDLGQLYYRFLSPSSFYQVIGNPHLAPEYAHSWQAGGEYVAAKRRARVGVNAFRNDVRDPIGSVSLGFVATPQQLADLLSRERLDPSFHPALGRVLLTYRNVLDAVTEGVEVDGEAALAQTLSLGGAYTYLSARDAGSGLALTGRHRHHGHVRISWSPVPGFRASVRGTFFSSWIAARATSGGDVSDTAAPGFALWDAFASQRIGGHLSLFATLENLADSQDPNTGVLQPDGLPAALYRPDAGRSVRAGIQWTLAGL